MSLFHKKAQSEKLRKQKEEHFASIDRDLNTLPHHTKEYRQETKAGWLASRGSQLAEHGDYKNAEADILEALSLCSTNLMVRVSAIDVYWRMDEFSHAKEMILTTRDEVVKEYPSVMAHFAFYDRSAAVFAELHDKDSYLKYAKKALAVLNSDEYSREDEEVSETLWMPRDNVGAFREDIEEQIREVSSWPDQPTSHQSSDVGHYRMERTEPEIRYFEVDDVLVKLVSDGKTVSGFVVSTGKLFPPAKALVDGIEITAENNFKRWSDIKTQEMVDAMNERAKR